MQFNGEILPFAIKLSEVYVKLENAGTISIKLNKVSAGELSRLCDIVREDVFREAGKPDPQK